MSAGFKCSYAMPDGVISIPSPQRADTLPDRPGESLERLISSAVSITALRVARSAPSAGLRDRDGEGAVERLVAAVDRDTVPTPRDFDWDLAGSAIFDCLQRCYKAGWVLDHFRFS